MLGRVVLDRLFSKSDPRKHGVRGFCETKGSSREQASNWYATCSFNWLAWKFS